MRAIHLVRALLCLLLINFCFGMIQAPKRGGQATLGVVSNSINLQAPTGVMASVYVQTITISWSSASHATGYNVWRSNTSGGPYTKIGSTTSLSYVDTGLSALVTYYYVVTATASGSQSGFSSEVSGTTTAGGAVYNMAYTPGGEGTAFNTWLQAQTGACYINANGGSGVMDVHDYTDKLVGNNPQGPIIVPAAVTLLGSLAISNITIGVGSYTGPYTVGILRVGNNTFTTSSSWGVAGVPTIGASWKATGTFEPSGNSMPTLNDTSMVIPGDQRSTYTTNSYVGLTTDQMATGFFSQPSADGPGQRVNAQIIKLSTSTYDGTNTTVNFQQAVGKTFVGGTPMIFPNAPMRGAFTLENITIDGWKTADNTGMISALQAYGVDGLTLQSTLVENCVQLSYDQAYCINTAATAANLNTNQAAGGVNVGYGYSFVACTNSTWTSCQNLNPYSLLGSVFIVKNGSCNISQSHCSGLYIDTHGMGDYNVSATDCDNIGATLGNGKWNYGTGVATFTRCNQGTSGFGAPSDTNLYQYTFTFQSGVNNVTATNTDCGGVTFDTRMMMGKITFPNGTNHNGDTFTISIGGQTTGTLTLGTSTLGNIWNAIAALSTVSGNLNGLYVGNGSGSYNSSTTQQGKVYGYTGNSAPDAICFGFEEGLYSSYQSGGLTIAVSDASSVAVASNTLLDGSLANISMSGTRMYSYHDSSNDLVGQKLPIQSIVPQRADSTTDSVLGNNNNGIYAIGMENAHMTGISINGYNIVNRYNANFEGICSSNGGGAKAFPISGDITFNGDHTWQPLAAGATAYAFNVQSGWYGNATETVENCTLPQRTDSWSGRYCANGAPQFTGTGPATTLGITATNNVISWSGITGTQTLFSAAGTNASISESGTTQTSSPTATPVGPGA